FASRSIGRTSSPCCTARRRWSRGRRTRTARLSWLGCRSGTWRGRRTSWPGRCGCRLAPAPDELEPAQDRDDLPGDPPAVQRERLHGLVRRLEHGLAAATAQPLHGGLVLGRTG